MTAAWTLLLMMGWMPAPAQPAPSVVELWMAAAPAQVSIAERLELNRLEFAIQQSA